MKTIDSDALLHKINSLFTEGTEDFIGGYDAALSWVRIFIEALSTEEYYTLAEAAIKILESTPVSDNETGQTYDKDIVKTVIKFAARGK